MNRFAQAIAVISAKAIMIGACSSGPSSSDANLAPSAIIEENKRILIVDETGKEWDVTHAKEKYGMEPSKFQFGLGPNAIRPILNPELLSPGDANYPDNHDDFLVLGTSLNGETRAYAIDKLIDHEIADEHFGDLHVAVAY